MINISIHFFTDNCKGISFFHHINTIIFICCNGSPGNRNTFCILIFRLFFPFIFFRYLFGFLFCSCCSTRLFHIRWGCLLFPLGNHIYLILEGFHFAEIIHHRNTHHDQDQYKACTDSIHQTACPSFSFLTAPFTYQRTKALCSRIFHIFCLNCPIFFSTCNHIILHARILLVISIMSSNFHQISQLMYKKYIFLVCRIFHNKNGIFLWK